MGLRHSTPSAKTDPQSNESMRAIETFVNLLMQNKHVNCTYMPDFIEKDIYRNLIIVVLANLKEWIRTIRLEILNHVITMNIEPIATITDNPPPQH